MNDPLQQLKEALESERMALLAHDVEALMQATEDKRQCINQIEKHPPHGRDQDLRLLADANLANGRLLTRRRREVHWALRHLGRSEDAPAYGQDGQADQLRSTSSIGQA